MKHTAIAPMLALTVSSSAGAVTRSFSRGANPQVNVQPAQPGFNFNGGFFQFVPGTGFVPLNNAGNNGIRNLFNPSTFVQPNQGPLVFVPGTGFVPQNLGQPNLITPNGVFGSTFPQPNQGPLVFVPGQGFVPDPTFQQNLGAAQLNANAVPTAVSGTPTFVPGNGYGGGGFYGGQNGGYFGGPYNGYPAGFPSGYAAPADGYAGTPTIAVQVTPGPRSAVRTAPAADPQQVRLASRLEKKMEDRPLTEGRVVKIGATGIQVRLTVDGQDEVRTYPVDQVFFYRRNASTGEDRLETASTDPSAIHEGDRVMVAINPAQPRQSVAGVRQETRSSTINATPPAIEMRVESSTTEPQQKVAGSRQTMRTHTRRRRPAH